MKSCTSLAESEITAGSKSSLAESRPDRRVIDEQHPVEEHLLAHQIFRRRDFLGVLALLLVLGPGMGDIRLQMQQQFRLARGRGGGAWSRSWRSLQSAPHPRRSRPHASVPSQGAEAG